MPISEEQPPSETEYNLSEWLVRIFRQARDEDAMQRRAILNLVPAGYGGGQQVANVAHDILTAYSTVPFDTLNPTVNRGVSFNTINNTFTFTAAGIWTIFFNMSLQGFNSLNSGRNFTARLYNVSQSVAGDGVIIGVGRNMQDIFVSTGFLVQISQSNVVNADEIRLETGNASADITGGTIINAMTQVTYSSELGALS